MMNLTTDTVDEYVNDVVESILFNLVNVWEELIVIPVHM